MQFEQMVFEDIPPTFLSKFKYARYFIEVFSKGITHICYHFRKLVPISCHYYRTFTVNKNFKRSITLVPIAFIIFSVWFLSENSPVNASLIEYLNWESNNNNFKTVVSKKSLLDVDVSNSIKNINFEMSPITNEVLTQQYSVNNLVGFVSNVDVDSHKHLNLNGKGKRYSNNKIQLQARASSETIPDVKKLEKEGRKSYDSLVTCESIQYNGTIEHSAQMRILGDDLLSLRRSLLKQGNWLAKELKDDSDKNKKEEDIVESQWFRFGGSSIWLESEQCYLVFSRIVYSRKGEKNHPHVSLVRAQAFDKNWQELIGKKIPYVDIDFPTDMDHELKKFEDELGIQNCKEYLDDLKKYEVCNTRQVKSHLQNQRRKDILLSRYYITYPNVLDIPFDANGDWKGPEDPHVILRNTGTYEEPIVIFNMDDPTSGGRRMFSYMPHRRLDSLQRLTIHGRKLRGSEKNWTPFFHPSDKPQSKLSRGFIHFIYSFNPLDIIKCSLNDGICETVFDGETLDLSEMNTFGGMRGGTQFVPLPSVLPAVKNKNIWIGFPKLHISHCGCGDIFYRPMLDLLIESGGVYHQELVVPVVDFGIDVLSWDLLDTDCKNTNILSPNSIVHWDVVDQNSDTKHYEDYMTLTISESDSLTKIVTLRGVLNYVLGIYKHKNIKNDFYPSIESNNIIGKTLSCLVQGAKQICEEYGENHKAL
ncbi:similar to Naumovozyma dairenensis NDAI_0G00360 hypothetical protein [Maudiozyma barnettii]|uniref:Glycosyltransferase family 91 protein n=1 Tax=Maudiozyma barnettii TaxID=61262 RepID=A0A8H2ZI75_9SACH|nr:uncharacterized protein KABA2_06S09086 [Kazachstania barnettii]CAB4255593.1 similar to Naumovozyma dairenensis NDAI_0G00360 hypothetical protein [Kazachstania barnettii]CAD1784091.1 similar to Naumovozyma dairenensis NDAI_0G00360 hypothetical protein [Kazachstania barnettii]